MQKYMMFEDMKAQQIMYPTGMIKSREDVIKDYPILGTPFGVIGIRCNDSGTVEDLVFMEYYNNVYAFVDSYKDDVAFTEGMSNAQKCDAITAFVNTPKAEIAE